MAYIPFRTLVGVYLSTAACFAAAPLARVISAAPVEVGGVVAPARNYVPAGAGDAIVTREQTAVVQFKDGSDLVLQPNSKVVVQGEAEHPSVQILRGSARYTLVSGSKLRVLDSKGESLDAVVGRAMQQSTQYVRGEDAASPALWPALAPAYRSPGTAHTGVAVPSSPVGTGQFYLGTTRLAGETGPQIISPSGSIINLVQQGNGYVVQSISVPVTASTGIVYVQVTTGSLVGATVTGITPTAQPGAPVTVGFVTPTGSTLTPTQVQDALQQGTTTAVNTAIANGQLPAGTPPPTPSPIASGTFAAASASAP